ncbi:hypothetical protein SDC9_181917 [bioreactor metagenome]|uniref:Uncharacterized protein n=1 Tax=bioreactor metagenome TaxID=1076179 RepID=A0A645HE97_9ZZZZ
MGQGSRFIRADNRRAPKRFHGGQALYQRVLLRHTLNRHCQGKRNGRKQSFGDKGDDHAEREYKGLGDRILYEKDCRYKE